MSNNEEGKSTQSDNPAQAPPPPIQEQSNVHVYHHDWAAMQAYYGPRVAILQYYNSNGHAPPPPYIWGSPSPMMAPYGAPYPPFCPPGGVYAHPGVQMVFHHFNKQLPNFPSCQGSQSQGPATQATPVVATPLSMEAPANSPGNTDQEFLKKLKEFDGLAMSVSNSKVVSAEHSRNSQSSENNDDSSDGNTTGGEQSERKRSQGGSPNNDGKPSSQITPLLRDETEKPAMTMGIPVMPTAMDFPQPCHGAPHEVWNEKEVKREKRKQSNRESARRSRLRKQAETEELSVKVDALVAENMTLRSKLSQLNNESEKLRRENETLLDQLKAQATENREPNIWS